MSRVEEIQTAIISLPEEDYSQLRQWFFERDRGEWDCEIKADAESGKLDFLLEEAVAVKRNDKEQ